MWLFTTIGFFSVVHSFDRVDRIVIRARDSRHLENLKTKFKLQGQIVSRPDSDYAYRIYVDQSTWVRIAKTFAEEITYTNFKDAAHENSGHTSKQYMWALYDVWETMSKLQR